LENLALGDRDVRGHAFLVSGSLSVAVARRGQATRLSTVTCTLGKGDKPYPEVHEHAAWTFALVRRGTFRYRGSATTGCHTLRSGWLLVGQPGAEFECSHEHDAGDECASLAISESVLWDVVAAANFPAKSLLRAPPALPPLPRVAALLERARVDDRTDMDEAGYLVAEAVVAQLGAAPSREVARHPSHVGRMHDAMDRMEASCRDPLSLGEVAASVGLSPFHFLRVFRSVTGTTPHQYLIGARLRLAVRMLLDTSRPVTEIAYEVGFQDLSNFVRTFHRVVGCSPRAYRRKPVQASRDHRSS
jgi:AraC-like DNA-binding protein